MAKRTARTRARNESELRTVTILAKRSGCEVYSEEPPPCMVVIKGDREQVAEAVDSIARTRDHLERIGLGTWLPRDSEPE